MIAALAPPWLTWLVVRSRFDQNMSQPSGVDIAD